MITPGHLRLTFFLFNVCIARVLLTRDEDNKGVGKFWHGVLLEQGPIKQNS